MPRSCEGCSIYDGRNECGRLSGQQIFSKTYGIYFFYSELNRSTQVVAAYEGKRHSTLYGRLLVKAAELLMRRVSWEDVNIYQFYEHRGFERAGERDIVMDMGEKQVPIKCLLYRRKL